MPQRIGGFGGVAGLTAYLRDEQITHIVDATHPFAARMSANAVGAAAEVGVPLVALTRPPWEERPADRWIRVPDIAGAVAALEQPARRVLLAVGRIHLDEFLPNPQHFYLLRLVDPPATPPGFPRHHVIVDRGPFDEAADTDLLREFAIDLVVSKNSGGKGAFAKILAARKLGLPVIMIDRPRLPKRTELTSVDDVIRWLDHAVTDLGV